MSLSTQVVVRCSILCSKFTKNCLLPGHVEGTYSAPPEPVIELRGLLCGGEEKGYLQTRILATALS